MDRHWEINVRSRGFIYSSKLQGRTVRRSLYIYMYIYICIYIYMHIVRRSRLPSGCRVQDMSPFPLQLPRTMPLASRPRPGPGGARCTGAQQFWGASDAAVDRPDGPLGLDARAELDAAHELARDRLSRRPARHNRARAPRTRHPGLLSAAGHPRARCSQRKSARALRARAAQGAGHVTLPSSTAKDHATGILPSPGSWRRSQQFWGV